jgi:hypothetical protein
VTEPFRIWPGPGIITAVKWINARTGGQMFLLFLGLWAALCLGLLLAVGLWSGWDGGSWLLLWPVSTSSKLALLISLVVMCCRRVTRRR